MFKKSIIAVCLLVAGITTVYSQGKLIPSYMGVGGLTNILGGYFIFKTNGIAIDTLTITTNANGDTMLEFQTGVGNHFQNISFKRLNSQRFFFQYDVTADELNIQDATGDKLFSIVQDSPIVSKFGYTLTAMSSPSAPSDGTTWNDSTQKALKTYVAGVTNALSGSLFTPTASKTVTNTTSETTLIPTSGVGAVGLAKSFPANFWTAGKVVHIHFEGYVNTVDAGTPEANFRWKFSGTTLTSSGSVFTSGTVDTFKMEMFINCYTTGVSGTFGIVTYVNSTAWAYSAPSFNDITVDTTAATTFDLTAEPADTFVSIRIKSGAIEVKN